MAGPRPGFVRYTGAKPYISPRGLALEHALRAALDSPGSGWLSEHEAQLASGLGDHDFSRATVELILMHRIEADDPGLRAYRDPGLSPVPYLELPPDRPRQTAR